MLRRSSLFRFGPCAGALVFSLFSAGCDGNSSASGGCGSHTYTYEDATGVYGGGAGWYGGAYDDGWYDPGDDGSDYSDIGDGSGSDQGSYYDDGSGSSGDGTYDDGSGSGGDGTYGDGTYDDGSGSDGTGSDGTTDDGSGSGGDSSGGDGSGDDGTASKKNLRISSAKLHTQSGGGGCYVYTCTLVCAVDSADMRAARGASGVSQADACATAEHGLENWAHDTLHRDVGACKQVSNDAASSNNAPPGSRTPASPEVTQGVSQTPTPPPVPRSARASYHR